jgi:hypothetical protein
MEYSLRPEHRKQGAYQVQLQFHPLQSKADNIHPPEPGESFGFAAPE